MDISLRQYFCIFLISTFASSIVLMSLPARASDQRPAPRRIRILKVGKTNPNIPNIITVQKSQAEKSAPIPKQKPESNEADVQKEAIVKEITKEPSIIKTLKLRANKTKVVKTTKETLPLTTPQAQKPAQRSITLPTTLSYCSESQQNDAVKAAMLDKPNTNKQKDMGLAVSLRTYMRAEKRDQEIIDALYIAAQKTGVSFELMAIKAMIESNLGTHTIAPNSSARGIFQYIDSTWLSLIKRHGGKIGHTSYANALEYDPIAKRFNTNQRVSISRENILDLRDNAKAASLIKAYQIIDEQAVLKEYKEGRSPTITDHYIMHMMGLPLSRTFYRLKNSNSPIIPANLRNGMFNKAIALNPSFFYDKNKNALNASQIYIRFANTTGAKIEALRKIDKRYGSGQNVTAQNCTPTPIRPRIHTPSADSFQNASSSGALNNVEPAAGAIINMNAPRARSKKHKNISSVALLQFEPSPITMQDSNL